MVSKNNPKEDTNCTLCSLEPTEKNPLVLQINNANSNKYSSFFPNIAHGRLCKRCHAKFRYNSKRSCALKDLECCICHIHYPNGNFARRFKVYIQAVKAIQDFYNDEDLKSGVHTHTPFSLKFGIALLKFVKFFKIPIYYLGLTTS